MEVVLPDDGGREFFATLSLLEFAIYFMYKTNKELYREYTYEFDKRNTYLQLAGYTIQNS